MTVEDTVISIERGPMTMEAILLRDQRTTSHRVLDREQPQSVTKTKIGIKDLVVENGNERTQIERLLERPATSRISRSTCCASACSQCRCRRLSCRYTDDENNCNNKKNDDRVSVQRHFRCDVSDVCRVASSTSSSSSSSSDDDRGIRSRRYSSTVTTTTWLRLSSLLVTLLVVSVHGAPTMTLNNRRLSTPPKWQNPCGHAAEDIEGDLEVEQLSDVQLLRQVLTPAENALMHVQIFRDNYVKRTFNVDFAELHSQWKEHRYDWLPSFKEIPKNLSQELDRKYLDTLELDKALLDAYEYMQKYAVGLEQIVWDQEDNDLAFRDQFKETQLNLGSILCELQVALVERAVTPRPDVTRDIMSDEYRSVSSSATFRDLRDWLIFRDYMNALEYIVQVFRHLRSGLES